MHDLKPSFVAPITDGKVVSVIGISIAVQNAVNMSGVPKTHKRT